MKKVKKQQVKVHNHKKPAPKKVNMAAIKKEYTSVDSGIQKLGAESSLLEDMFNDDDDNPKKASSKSAKKKVSAIATGKKVVKKEVEAPVPEPSFESGMEALEAEFDGPETPAPAAPKKQQSVALLSVKTKTSSTSTAKKSASSTA